MINADKLADILSKVHLNKAINECVLTCKKGKVHIYAIDLMESVCVQIISKLDNFPECKIGLSNIQLLIKYLQSVKESELSINIKDNRMVINADGHSRVSYLLDPIDVIPTYIDEAFDSLPDLIKKEMKSYKYSKGIALSTETISDFLKVNSLFNPNSVSIKVDKKGIVSIHAGSETEHIIDVTIGKTETSKCDLKLYAANFAAVLNIAMMDNDPRMYISTDDSASVIVKTVDASWILKLMNV